MEKDNPDAVKAIREGYHFTVNLETGEFQELKYEKGVLMYIPVKSESPNEKKR
jgi:hypothetical protein